jgi:2-amino-4-hydroxy-6-hydroxymethyldihydropteridine diphosphokinase
MPESYVLLAFGTNLGDRQEQWQRALTLLPETGLQVVSISRLWETPPIGGPAGQAAFLNAALTATTTADPQETVRQLLKIEATIGRVRTARWGARLIDLDLLLYDQVVSERVESTVPHPRMTFRRFMLDPALEVAADWVHPLTGTSLAELASALSQAARRVEIKADPRWSPTWLKREPARSNLGQVLERVVSQIRASGYQVMWEASLATALDRAAPTSGGHAATDLAAGDDRGGAEYSAPDTQPDTSHDLSVTGTPNLTLMLSAHTHPPRGEIRGPYLILPIEHPETWLFEVSAALAAMN